MVSSPIETSAYEVPIGSILLEDGKELKIFPKSAGQDFNVAKPFSIERIFTISRLEENPFYDLDSRVLAFQINSPNLLQQQIREAKKAVVQYYNAGDSNIEESDVFIRPLTISSYEIVLDTLEDDFIVETGVLEDGPFSVPIRVVKDISNDDNIHLQLKNNPERISVIVRMFSRFRLDNVNTVTASRMSIASQEAYEKVFGNGNDGEDYLVDREVAQELKQELSQQISYTESIANPNAGTENIINFVDNYIDDLSPIEISDLETSSDSMIIYGVDGAKEEIKPTDYKNQTNSWEKHEDIEESVEKTWDNLSDIANKEISDSKFHEEVKEELDTSGSGSAKANILKIGSGSTKFNLHYKKDYEELTETEQKNVKDSRDILKSTGSEKQEYIRKAVEKWTGDDYEAGKIVKNLDLVRIVYADLVNN